MTDSERREAARQFYNKWVNRGKEDEDDRSYWIGFLQDVMGVDHVTDRIEFQKKVVGPDGNTKRIDAYIPETRVLIEQKSLGIDLAKPQQGHDGMTPYEQAKMYDNSLPVSEKSKWIIVSNFREIWIYDMDTRIPEPQIISLSEIPSKYSLFEFLTNKQQQKISQEMEISVKAGEFVGLIYDALLKQYYNPENEDSLKSLNMLCVRLVFCLLASNVHMAWVRAVCGRLKSDYRYSKDIVYNNYPWPNPTDEQKTNIEQTAQGILDARMTYPDSSLADLYDPLTMPPQLQKAHFANDRAVMQAYGFLLRICQRLIALPN